MNRYIIVIPAKNRSFVLKCDEGDGMKLETLQKLVSGYVETVPAALDATWAREEADRLVLAVDEDGRLKCKAAGVYKARGRHHLQRVAVRRGWPCGRQKSGTRGSCPRI